MKGKNIDRIIEGALIGVAVGGIVLLLIWMGIDFVKDWNEMQTKMKAITTETTYLASVNYTSEVDGYFYIGHGSVKETQYYVAYEILEDGGKKLFKMRADITTIYDVLEADELAYAETDKDGWGIVKIRLYVPKGTITQDYNLSLE